MTSQETKALLLNAVMSLRAAIRPAALSLICVGLQCATAQDKAVTAASRAEDVSFCDLIRHPDEFNSKTVRVAGRYGHGPEGSSFVDSTCEKSESGSEISADAKFDRYDAGAVKAFKKIYKFLKKHHTSEAQVTVIA